MAPSRGKTGPLNDTAEPIQTFRAKHRVTPCLQAAVAAWVLFLAGSSLIADENPLGVQVPEGFEVTQFASDTLAHDIYSMTIDAQGRVVVSGAGYVKILIDADRDGVAETAKVYLDQIPTGAQGMYFLGRDLICAAGEGLVRYRDRNGDDRADGPPDVFLKVKTGNEHDLHAIRKGPDGWWYMIAGNSAEINAQFAGLPTSPVKTPHAGAILRMKPDLTAGEIYSHGLRNAYDFDFSTSGDLFTFDSDGEKVLSLPWYRPTRVLHVQPGTHAGWVSDDWIRPDHYFDMPPVVASMGRGSPTGVAVYQHRAFPDEYHGALFLLDWTYGKVYALLPTPEGKGWKGRPVEFMSAVGQNGFAPTDIEIGPQGEMYVCVGGRGTRGGVYCIRPKRQNPSNRAWPGGSGAPELASEKLAVCLHAPQPLSSWSRRIWEPLARQLTSGPFIKAAMDESLPTPERIRAIEILTDKFNGIDRDLAARLVRSRDAAIRARTAWSLGRSQPRTPDTQALGVLLADADPQVIRAAMEAVTGADAQTIEELAVPVGNCLAHQDRTVRQTAMRMLSRTTGTNVHKIAQIGFSKGWNAAIPVAGAHALSSGGFAGYAVEIGTQILRGNQADSLKLEATRIIQMGLGDLTPPAGRLPPVYDGYAPRLDLSAFESQVAPLRTALPDLYPTGKDLIDQELERIIAMVQPASPDLLARILEKITSDSSPVDDIHRLIVISRLPVPLSPAQRTHVANAMVHLTIKVESRNLPRDSDWDERVVEMYEVLSRRNPELQVSILENPAFGLPGHVQLIRKLPAARVPDAVALFSRRIHAEPDYAWNSDVIFLLAASTNPKDKARIREKFSDYSLRNAVLSTLAIDPEEHDRPLFLAGLESSPVETMLTCIGALQLLKPSAEPSENVLFAKSLRTLGDHDEERQARDQLVELLQRNLREDHGYILGREGDPQRAAIAAWLKAVQARFPREFASVAGGESESLEDLRQRLTGISWQSGNAAHGQQLFAERGCAQCHGQSKALGPSLEGVAGRFSREDLFTAIVLPSRDVSPRYQTTQIATTDGHLRTGMILYEAVDAIAIRDANNQTYRIGIHEIEARRTLSQSLMPSGLLKGLSDQDFADLYAYLQSLGQPPIAAAPPLQQTQ